MRDRDRDRGEAARGAFGGQIRNCRHIENHNSWRRAEDRAAIPGAYRDRYLDRVTINTDPPGKVAMGIIWGPRGEVTYTYSHAGALRPLLVNPPSPHPVRSAVFRLPRVEGARYRARVIISDTREISVTRALVTAYALRARADPADLVLARRRLKARKAAGESGRTMLGNYLIRLIDGSIFIVDPFFRASSLSIRIF